MAKKSSRPRRTKGSGSLFLAGRIWYCRFHDETGKRIERSTGTSDKATADRVLAKWVKEVHELKTGLVDPAQHKMRSHKKRPVNELLDEYISSCSKRAQAKRNISQKKKQLGDWIQAASANTLEDLTADSLLNHLEGRAAKGLSHRCWNHTLQITNAFMNWCKKMGYIGANPLTEIPKKDEELDPRMSRRALTDEEVERLMTVARERGREAWYATPLYSGLRKAELERLEWSDVDMAGGQITIRKTKSKMVQPVALCPELREILERHQAQTGRSSGLVWTTTVTDRTRDSDLERAKIPKVDSKGRRADLHALRATLGTRLARTGVSPQLTQQIMRHASLETTQRHYTLLTLEDQRRALSSLYPQSAGNGDASGVVQFALPDSPLNSPLMGCFSGQSKTGGCNQADAKPALIDSESTCGCSSVGRASASQAECRGFESRLPLSVTRRHGAPTRVKAETHRAGLGRDSTPAPGARSRFDCRVRWQPRALGGVARTGPCT